MRQWKVSVEAGFGRLAAHVHDNPLLYLLSIVVVTLALASQLRNIYFDTSTEGFLSPDHPSIQLYNAFRGEFGRDELIVVGVESANVLDLQFLQSFREIFFKLDQGVPYTSSVDSLINARYVYGEGDDLIVEDLFDTWPENAEDMAELQRRIATNPLYEGLYLNRERTLATIVIRLRYLEPEPGTDFREVRTRLDQEISASLEAIKEAVQPYRDQGLTIHIAGSPVISDLLKWAMVTDMKVFMKWVLIINALLLFLLFRRVSAVIYPLLAVGLSVVCIISLMAAFRQPLQLPTAIVPSFLLVVGIGDSIHYLSLFFAEYNEHGDKRRALISAMEHSGLAMFLTSLTTAAGLGSFITADLLPVANMGIFTSVGVMLAFVLTVIVLPALITLTPIKPKGRNQTPHTSVTIDRLIEAATHISYHHPKSVILVSSALLVISCAIAAQLRFSHNPLVWLPDKMPVKQSTVAIDHLLGGTISVEVLVDTGRERGLLDPALLLELDAICAELARFKTDRFAVGKVLSITDLLKESNRALHDNDPSFYHIPQSNELVSQELLLLELNGADDLYRLVDRKYQTARITLLIPWIDTLYYNPLMDTLHQRFHSRLGERAQIQVTGLVPLLGSTLDAVIRSAAQSYVIAMVVIGIIMMFLLGSPKLGLLSMFPNILPIAMIMGLMYLGNAPLDMFTMLIGSIAIGLCVDDTVHFMHHYRRFRDKGLDVESAIRQTLFTAGRAMIVTSVVLCCGFLVLLLSEMNNFNNFGLYCALCILFALVADFLLAPALMVAVARHEDPAFRSQNNGQ